jgi:hypothetical protein
MTYDQDPARWSTDPDEAPELLRGAFAAGRNEAPSRGQMRSLAVKLAAASAGGAVAVGTVKAASAGNTIATAATWSAAKVAGVIALAGSVVTGAVVWHSGSDAPAHDRVRAPMHAAEAPALDTPSTDVSREGAAAAPVPSRAVPVPSVESLSGSQGRAPARENPVIVPSQPNGPAVGAEGARLTRDQSARISAAAPTSRATEAEPRRAEPRRKAAKPAAHASTSSTRADSPRTARAVTSSAEPAPASEVSLLRSAQVALQSRPREAFQLTQQHRRLYPAGEFAQERDALAIQALMRAGETEQARELAQAFIRAYPSSPHAHRFREAMGLR